MKGLDSINNVKKYIMSHLYSDTYKLFFLYSYEEKRCIKLLEDLANEMEVRNLYIYDCIDGILCKSDKKLQQFINFGSKKETDFKLVLEWIVKNAKGYVILNNIYPILEQDHKNIRALKVALEKIKANDLFIKFFIISPIYFVYEDLKMDTLFLDIPLPNRDEIKKMLIDMGKSHGYFEMSPIMIKKFIDALNGMREEDIINALQLCLYDGQLNEEDIDSIIDIKHITIKKDSLIEFINTDENIQSIGGMKKFKEWLLLKAKVLNNYDKAVAYGVEMPKGILLIGLPGCGKSLSAKAIGNIFQFPLLRLDIGRILGPYVGQSEENIRKAIKIAESVAPSILWIDELEKSFSRSKDGGGGEVMTRILGTFLTWMQEKTKLVFVVATANRTDGIPPELQRTGRFDEIFFTDYPNDEARKEILKIHLKKRGHIDWYEKIDIEYFVEKTKEFLGSDIEALVKELIERSFVSEEIEGNKVDVDQLLKSILQNFISSSFKLKEDIDEIRKFCKEKNAKPVD